MAKSTALVSNKGLRACPKCSSYGGVISTREGYRRFVMRRRACVGCGYRWSTAEVNYQFYKTLLKSKALAEDTLRMRS